jgi:hypothetical protein
MRRPQLGRRGLARNRQPARNGCASLRRKQIFGVLHLGRAPLCKQCESPVGCPGPRPAECGLEVTCRRRPSDSASVVLHSIGKPSVKLSTIQAPVAASPNDALYSNPFVGFQATGGSTPTRARTPREAARHRYIQGGLDPTQQFLESPRRSVAASFRINPDLGVFLMVIAIGGTSHDQQLCAAQPGDSSSH